MGRVSHVWLLFYCFITPSAISLMLTYLIVIKPYRIERDNFLDTTCSVTRHTKYGVYACTYSCGKSCTGNSKFPCVAITVKIRDKDNRTKESSLFLHHEKRTCSVYECGASVRETTEKVRKRLQQWPIGRQAPCVYNRTDDTQTKEKRQFSPIPAFNALFWSLWGTILGVIGLVAIHTY